MLVFTRASLGLEPADKGADAGDGGDGQERDGDEEDDIERGEGVNLKNYYEGG